MPENEMGFNSAFKGLKMQQTRRRKKECSERQ
jgi:hypothetical protein